MRLNVFTVENKATYLHTKENRSYLLDHSLEHWHRTLRPSSILSSESYFYCACKRHKRHHILHQQSD